VGIATAFRIIESAMQIFNTALCGVIHIPDISLLRHQFAISRWVIGVIDGTALGIRRPQHRQDRFYRGDKARHFLSLLVVCDSQGLVIWIGIGYPGHNNDQANYRRSSIRSWLLQQDSARLLSDGGFFGDELIRPVIKPSNPLMRLWNELVQDERAIVEHVNADLKEFNVLATTFRGSQEQLCQAALSVAILHNLKILWKTQQSNDLRVFCVSDLPHGMTSKME
jgi:hypothetical protein